MVSILSEYLARMELVFDLEENLRCGKNFNSLQVSAERLSVSSSFSSFSKERKNVS